MVAHLKSAAAIWVALARESGSVSDIKRGEQQMEFYNILKYPSSPIADHMHRYVQLQQQVDYHCPAEEPTLSKSAVNLNFIRSLGPDWRTFNHSIGNEIRKMPRLELFARVKIFAQTAPENAPHVPQANYTSYNDPVRNSHDHRLPRSDNKKWFN